MLCWVVEKLVLYILYSSNNNNYTATNNKKSIKFFIWTFIEPGSSCQRCLQFVLYEMVIIKKHLEWKQLEQNWHCLRWNLQSDHWRYELSKSRNRILLFDLCAFFLSLCLLSSDLFIHSNFKSLLTHWRMQTMHNSFTYFCDFSLHIKSHKIIKHFYFKVEVVYLEIQKKEE